MAFVETYLSPRYCTESVKYCRSSQRGRFHISRRTVGDDRSGALWSSRRGDAPVRRPARQRQSAREERGRRHLAPARSHRGESLRGAADGPRLQVIAIAIPVLVEISTCVLVFGCRFRKRAQELSVRFRDRPLPPLETAIYWVEYVARHGGGHHMRTAAVDMPLYKYLLLDVIAFLLLVIGAAAYVFSLVVKIVFRKLFGRRDKQKTN
jgi:hypothetical protein